MKLPKTFIPEKNLENNVKALLSEKVNPKHFEKVILDQLTLDQLKELTYLEHKIDHVKIGFEYLGDKHQLVYTLNYDNKSLLQLLQMPPELSIDRLTSLANTLKSTFNTSATYEVVYQTWPNGCLVIDFPISLGYGLAEKFKQFFLTHNALMLRNKKKKRTVFTDIKVYIEYNDLTKEDMKYLNTIPKNHWLEKSKTYSYK